MSSTMVAPVDLTIQLPCPQCRGLSATIRFGRVHCPGCGGSGAVPQLFGARHFAHLCGAEDLRHLLARGLVLVGEDLGEEAARREGHWIEAAGVGGFRVGVLVVVRALKHLLERPPLRHRPHKSR